MPRATCSPTDDRSFDARRRGSSRGVACVHALSSRKRVLGTTRIIWWKPVILQLSTKHDLKGAGLILKTHFRDCIGVFQIQTMIVSVGLIRLRHWET